LLKQIESAFKRNDIKAVVLAIDSPGGGVFESDQVYQKILEMKKEYRKPLVVSMGSMAASGGYYIAAPADLIVANRNTLTGSIGVIMSSYNYRQLADKIGIKEEVFKSGENKDLLNPMREATPEERQIMQSIVDESYGYFIDVVAQGRHLDRQKVIDLADGRVYTARQAQQLGLVDKIGSLDDAVNEAARLINENDPQVLMFKNENPFGLEWLLSMVSMKADLLDLKNSMTNSTPSLMYMYQ
jgi:protease-4